MDTTRFATALQNGLVGEEADAVDVEDLLGDHGTTHQGTDVLAEVGDDWNQGVTQHVAQHDLTVRHALARAVRT